VVEGPVIADSSRSPFSHVAALLLVVSAQLGPAPPLTLGSVLTSDDNGPPPGSPNPPPPPLVQDQRRPVDAAAPGDISTEASDTSPPARYPPPPPPDLPRDRSDVGARVLWGLGVRGGLGVPQITEDAVSGLQLGFDGALYLRVGAQLNDLWGAEAELHGGTISTSSLATGATPTQGGYLGGALTIDATPVDWFTVALGPLVDGYASFAATAAFASPALGGTLRCDFHPWAGRATTGRTAFTIGVVGDIAAALGNSDGQPVGGVYLTVGYAHY
jgi:hypothetical protein